VWRRFRPAVVWFGEALPPEPWSERPRRSRAPGAAGRRTSGIVQPAARSPRHFVGPDTFVVEVNPEATPISEHADVVLRGKAAEILPQLIPRKS